MNMLLFVIFTWAIIFMTWSRADSDSSDGDDGDGYRLNAFDFVSDNPDRCPCTPRGEICDILATCQRDACAGVEGGGTGEEECDPLDCARISDFGPFDAIDALFCGNDPFITDTPIISALFTPVFATISFGRFGGICVSSYDGIAGIVRGIFQIIGELIDEFDDCDDRRRRLSFLHQDTMKAPDTATATNPFHGSAVSFEYFVQLLEWNGSDRNELMGLIMKEGGIAHLAGMMKQQAQGSGTTTRRLLDSSDSGDDDFGICKFGFLRAFLGRILRRRLQFQQFDPATDPFEALLATLLASSDCENHRDATPPMLCLFKDTLNGRRRLESDDSDDSGDGDGDDEFCCGDIGTSIQFTSTGQDETCFEQIQRSFGVLNQQFTPGDGCSFVE